MTPNDTQGLGFITVVELLFTKNKSDLVFKIQQKMLQHSKYIYIDIFKALRA